MPDSTQPKEENYKAERDALLGTVRDLVDTIKNMPQAKRMKPRAPGGPAEEAQLAIAPSEPKPAPEATKPDSWKSYRSVAPYYKKNFAEELLPILDVLLEDEKVDRKILYKQLEIAPSSLVVRVNQAWTYIMDKMDPEGKYATLRRRIVLKKELDGLRFSWRRDDTGTFTGRDGRHAKSIPMSAVAEVPRQSRAVDKEDNLKWKTQLVTYLQTSEPGEVLHLSNLDLDENQLIFARSLLSDSPHISVIRLESFDIKLFHGAIPTAP